MNKYSLLIFELRNEILNSIKTILKNNRMGEISVNDSSDRTFVIWWSNKDFIYEGQVLLVKLKDNQLSVVVDPEESLGKLELFEDSFALESPIWLNGIRDNILEALMEIHPRVCYDCGKPMKKGYCIDNGSEHYCSDECLHKHYTPEQWDEMYDGGNSDSYWAEWEEDNCA